MIMMARLQPTEDQNEKKPKNDAQAVSEANASRKNHGKISKSNHNQMRHGKLKSIIHTSNDDQIDSSIIFDGPYEEDDRHEASHALNDHD
nr:hypothetical protein [Tanacetum cinerariifolium]